MPADCVEGIDAQKVLSLAAIYKDEKKAIVPYPSGVGARGFHNGRFIQKLRGKAASLPKYVIVIYFLSLEHAGTQF